ncbi:hypothetical protein Tco_1327866 [Tanacetum coccineum]
MSEARMREIIRDQVTTSMNEFMANMNRGAGGAGAGGDGAGGAGAGGAGAGGAGAGGDGAGGAGAGGAGPVEAEVTGCTYMTFMKCNPHTFKGTEGAVGLCQWFEKLESVFRISDCREKDKVKFATATLQGRALTWWNGRTASKGYYALNDKTDEVHEGEKRKGEGDRGDNRRDYNHRQNQRRVNAGAMTNAVSNDNEVCPKCKNKKHNGDCWKCDMILLLLNWKRKRLELSPRREPILSSRITVNKNRKKRLEDGSCYPRVSRDTVGAVRHRSLAPTNNERFGANSCKSMLGKRVFSFRPERARPHRSHHDVCVKKRMDPVPNVHDYRELTDLNDKESIPHYRRIR